jgi:hypothetical protein
VADLLRHQKFGETIFTLRDVHRVPVRRLNLPLQAVGGFSAASTLVVRLADILETAATGHVDFTAAVAGLPTRCTPFLQALRYVHGEWELFHRSETVRDVVPPVTFESFQVWIAACSAVLADRSSYWESRCEARQRGALLSPSRTGLAGPGLPERRRRLRQVRAARPRAGW